MFRENRILNGTELCVPTRLAVQDCVCVCEQQNTYWFELAEQADPTCPHLMKLHCDSSFRCDACDRSLSILLMDDLSTQPQPPVDAPDHSQHGHQTTHPGALRVRKVLLQESLGTESETERETERQRQRERETERQRQRDRQTERHSDRGSDLF